MTVPTPPGGPLTVDGRLGSVWINGILLTDLWAQVQTPLVLWRRADTRVDRLTVPNVPGDTEYGSLAAGSQRDVKLALNGYVLFSGGAPASPERGLESNLDYVNTTICSFTALRSIAVTRPSGASKSGWGKVSQFVEEDTAGPIVVGTLRIFLPDGELV